MHTNNWFLVNIEYQVRMTYLCMYSYRPYTWNIKRKSHMIFLIHWIRRQAKTTWSWKRLVNQSTTNSMILCPQIEIQASATRINFLRQVKDRKQTQEFFFKHGVAWVVLEKTLQKILFPKTSLFYDDNYDVKRQWMSEWIVECGVRKRMMIMIQNDDILMVIWWW